ncbi:hypothetical protein GSI_03863 [Ganoderma sinense ZZ0214-1]|uniref:F-box domain-containing protein n=1 Tax=Ganoderma sinense ZZ0214-1 TaxID=1077348 RepID=A0A2G8SK74_9APHY|nr:hypothetical protein GSI_03863 [Ganoderma sinense ZZ0214-1]
MLPPELVDHILDYLHDDIQSLGACAAAGRPLLHTSRYHRFNGCHLTYIRAVRLEPLLESSSTLARSIKSLVYRPFARSPGDYIVSPPAAVTILKLLPKLIDLRIQAKALPCIIDLGGRLSYLRLDDVWTQTRRDMLVGLSLFFKLEELEFSDPYPMLRLDEHDSHTGGPSAPRVRKLSFRNTGCAEMITQWFSAKGRVPRLLSVTYTIRGKSHAHLFVAQSRTLAPLVRDLEIVFKPDGTMQGALESVDLTLASYAALHSCTLRFALPEMCVAENTSLAWIPTIIGQLSSASLGSLTISLVVDNVEDLRSLNSECAVRVLTTVYFDDLRVLDWAAMSQALSVERLEGLRKVVFEGCGRRELLEEHIRITCPELHTRGIVLLAAVAKEASWAD